MRHRPSLTGGFPHVRSRSNPGRAKDVWSLENNALDHIWLSSSAVVAATRRMECSKSGAHPGKFERRLLPSARVPDARPLPECGFYRGALACRTMQAPCAAISNLGDRSSHAKESALLPTQTLRVLRISSSNCGAFATLSRFLNYVTLPGGLLGRIPTHSKRNGGVA
jgi:hypothetical protein